MARAEAGKVPGFAVQGKKVPSWALAAGAAVPAQLRTAWFVTSGMLDGDQRWPAVVRG
jgi:hypothetical protein